MAGRRLTPKQQAFVRELLRNGGNATGAYRLAFNHTSDASAAASKLIRHPLVVQALAKGKDVQANAMDRAIERYGITQDRVAEELARLAFTRMPQVADVRTEVDQHGKRRQVVVVHDFADADPEALAAIVEVKRTAGGEISIKLADKRAALMDLARFKGWIADKPVDQRQLVMLKIER